MIRTTAAKNGGLVRSRFRQGKRPTVSCRAAFLAAFLLVGSVLTAPSGATATDTPAVLEVLATSRVPDPATSPYDDCLIVARVRVLEDVEQWARGSEILVAFWAFRDRVPLPGSLLAAGQRISARLEPFATSQPAREGIRIVDEMLRFDLPLFLAPSPDVPSGSPSDDPAEEGLREPISRSSDPAAIRIAAAAREALIDRPSREEALAEDLRRIRGLRDRHGSFDAWFRSLGPLRAELRDHPAIREHRVREDGSYFENLEVVEASLGRGPSWPGRAIESLSQLNRWLQERGVDLIVVPVPLKELVVFDSYLGEPPADGVLQPHRLEIFLALLEADIEVIDLVPALRENRSTYGPLYYPTSDQHPADGAVQVAADVLSRRLLRYLDRDELLEIAEGSESARWTPWRVTATIPAELTRRRYRRGFPADFRVTATQVRTRSEALLERTRTSRFLVLGDSYVVTTRVRGVPAADIWAQIARRTGILPAYLNRRGQEGAPQARATLERLGRPLLDDAEVCILFFNEEYLLFADSEWLVDAGD